MSIIIESDLDIESLIKFMERAIEQDKLILQAHEALKNDLEHLHHDYQITQAEILLCLLRRCL